MRTQHNRVYSFWLCATLFVSLLLIAGCMQVIPESPKQRLATLDAQVTAVITTAADLRAGGLMNDTQYQRVDKVIQNLNRAMAIAWTAIGTGDMGTVEAQIQIINKALWEVRNQLSDIQQTPTTGGVL